MVGPARRWKRPLQAFWCKACLALIGLQVRRYGEKARSKPVLYVSNHVSYLDIPVLAAEIEGIFVAKADVGSWPLFGTAAKVTGTIFVNRSGIEAKAQRDELVQRIQDGDCLIIFPEGTSTDGSDVVSFKSSLFSVVEQIPTSTSLVVQPISICYTRLVDGRPLIGSLRRIYGWFGDDVLVPHLNRLLGLPGAFVDLRFHELIPVKRNGDRKEIAWRAYEAVRRGVLESNATLSE
jgi:1-acyl-sn-glycerol-3-phosphate acyltransferase